MNSVDAIRKPVDGGGKLAMDAMALPESDVLAAANGDRDAYARLVNHYARLVSSLSLAIVRERATSEDVAQEVFLAGWVGLPRLRNSQSFLPWLRQVTRNLSHRQRRGQRPAAPPEALEELADPHPAAPERLVAAQEEEALEQAMSALNSATREVVMLYYREGRSVAQVAALLDMREDAVKQRLSRARSQLREEVLARLGESLERSAPGPQFTERVLAAIPIGVTPGLALGGGAKLAAALGKASGMSIAAKALPAAGQVLSAMASWLPGLFIGIGTHFRLYRKAIRDARDDIERRTHRRLLVANVVATLAFAIGTPLCKDHSRGWLPATLLGVAFMGTILWTTTRSGRLLASRLTQQSAQDPDAAARQRRLRRLGYLGAAVGVALGTAPYVWFIARRWGTIW